MMLVDEGSAGADLLAGAGEAFPAEVEFVISALEAGPKPTAERQKVKRTVYRVRAAIRLFSDPHETPATLLYTRHVNPQAVGFLTNRRLPLSHGGILYIPSPDQQKVMQVYCTVLRCREAAPGWYEGAAYFNRQQNVFAAEKLG
jgi:hypothetical protein